MQDKTQTNYTKYYNLDAIISVGYRVRYKPSVTFGDDKQNGFRRFIINLGEKQYNG
jgi:hypothetical protein